ncbi:cytotoxic translational repressor of toxin-antitoxin stability system [Rhodomicrobium udaipurense JA643]|uniref:Type II toxin-antitoxin system RelE/ParE family toxin n=2 Tax=Rhodomicrobium udaipurense TaxID=1202716 RepID=A0A8I1GE49_9HYPH|nr:type II toxin-antitoxin system RelE/ParE family toxin [Rhodomicrobium udaipurense]KAI94099.1 cytotoxic translational repressor of toxin-antitoxin stability system [Rhodomicrobium udaipurense JA643]MBJ7543274.1 type II toxin-antitoxin system RelE/ParE family toxin [Rhodomicrobium udaipurense]
MKTVTYTKEAEKTLAKMPANLAAKIRAKMVQYATDPASLANNVIAMKGQPGFYRMRIGDWRVIFTEDGVVILVVKVAPRGGAYE